MAASKKTADRPVLITTLNRLVLFGYVTKAASDAWERAPEKATLKARAGRCCVYWSADCKGFMGLAANGPTKSCKIGPAADITLRNITSILEVTADAEKAWQAAPWA